VNFLVGAIVPGTADVVCLAPCEGALVEGLAMTVWMPADGEPGNLARAEPWAPEEWTPEVVAWVRELYEARGLTSPV
jgi:hypothetical protein